MKWQIEFPSGDTYVAEADCGYEAWTELCRMRTRSGLNTPSFTLCDVQPYDDHDAIREPSPVLSGENTVEFIDCEGRKIQDVYARFSEQIRTEVDNAAPEPEGLGPQEYISSDETPSPSNPAKFYESAKVMAADIHSQLDRLMLRLCDACQRIENQDGIISELLQERRELLAENARLRNEQAFAGVIAEQSSTGGVWEGDPDANDHD